MQDLNQLVYFNLPIPVWQVISYVGLLSFLMIQRRFRLSFVASFALVLFWLHYAYRADLTSIITADYVARAIYHVLGFALVIAGIYASCFLQDDADALLDKREREIADLRSKAKDAENRASSLESQLEKGQKKESSARNKLEKKLSAKIEKLASQLKESETLAEQRAAEIAELEAKTGQAQQNASTLEDQIEDYRQSILANESARQQLEETFNATVLKLEQQLEESASRLEKRNTEIAELGAKASEAADKALALEAQLQQEQANESAGKQQLENQLNAKIENLEQQVKQGQTLLEQRAAEIAELEAKAREAETNADAFKQRLESDQSQKSATNKALEEELNGKILKLEQQLKDRESLLEKRNAEIAELRAKPAEIGNRVPAPKTPTAKGSPAVKTKAANGDSDIEEDVRRKLHQFQYAVKYLEDQIKEKDQLLSLMAKKHTQTQAASGKTKVDEDLRKKINQLEQEVKLIGQQSKEKDGLLALMAKRNQELAELKAKAEEKLQKLEKGGDEGQVEQGAA